MVGIKAANALSDFLIVSSVRDGKNAVMDFARGIKQNFTVEKSSSNASRGTTIHFLPDRTIFKEDGITLSKEKILQRLKEFSFLCSGLQFKFSYKDDEEIELMSHDGIIDYVKTLAPEEKRITNIFKANAEEGSYKVEIALCYSEGYSETIKAYTNNIPNVSGTHLTGYRSAMTRTVNDSARQAGLLKPSDDNLTGEDLKEGLVLVLSLNMQDPVFSGQTKEVLTSSEGRTVVERMLGPEIRQWFQRNPEELKAIVTKALTSKKARLAAKRAREATRGKTRTVLRSTLQGKLADCISRDPDKAEIFLVEGE